MVTRGGRIARTVWSTFTGSLALLRGRLSQAAVDAAILAKYAEPVEIEASRTRRSVGLLPSERSLLGAHLAPGARILDVGCATGRVTLALRRAGHRVLGVDLNPALVGEAATLPRETGVPLHVAVMDARALGVRPAWFDAVLMIDSVIGYVRSRAARVQALREARRALRPGGKFFVVTPSRTYSWKFRAWFAVMAVLWRLLRLAGAAALDWEPGDRVGPALSGDTSRLVYWHMYAPSELEADLGAAGFDVLWSAPRGYMMSFVATVRGDASARSASTQNARDEAVTESPAA